MDIDHVTRLQEFLANEAIGCVTFDLSEITLVDRAAVRFLAEAEAAGIRLVNCPEYVRSWIAAERGPQQQPTQEPDVQELLPPVDGRGPRPGQG